MAAVTFITDTLLSVVKSNGLQPLLGFDSKFDTEPHPETGNTIQGWVWDERQWASELEINNEDFSPMLWDGNNAPLGSTSFQSGIGDNKDVLIKEIALVVPSGTRSVWAPQVVHGNYYDMEEDFYLYSDDSVSQIVPNQTTSGLNFVTLDFTTKDGIPVTLVKWKFDVEVARYNKFIDFTHKFKFTGSRDVDGNRQETRDADGEIIFDNIDSSLPEFIIDSSQRPFVAYLNDDYIVEHGVPPASGLIDMELLGTAIGVDGEEFNTLFSPVIVSGVEIVSYFSDAGPHTTWNIVDAITTSGEALFDYDLGVVKFGAGEGNRPAGGEKIAAHYKSSTMLEYERDFTRDCINALEANVNPMGRTSSDGFLYLNREIIDPFSIVLTAEAPLIATDFYGPVFLGSNGVPLNAEVLSKTEESVEGAEVTFFLVNDIGSFSGGQNSITSFTGFNGIARTNFNTPRNVDAIGAIGESVAINSPVTGQSTVTISGASLTGDATTWQIYKVFTDDPIQGVDSAQQYYIDYLIAENITGPTAVVEADGSGWENTHRLLTGLLAPNQYDTAFRNGKKQLLVTFESTAINPHTYTEGAFVPLRPLEYNVGGAGETNVSVSGILDLPQPAVTSGINNRLAGYFIAGPTVARLQASVKNERLGTTIFSNTIDVEIRVSPSMDGTVLIEALNDVQRSGLSVPVGILEGTLPLGFRLRGFGVTLAGVLGGLTYLDVNRPTEVVGHAFEVVDSGVN